MAGMLTFGRCCACPDLKYMRQDLDLWSWGDLSFEEMDTLTALQVRNTIMLGRHDYLTTITCSYEWCS